VCGVGGGGGGGGGVVVVVGGGGGGGVCACVCAIACLHKLTPPGIRVAAG